MREYRENGKRALVESAFFLFLNGEAEYYGNDTCRVL